MRARQATRGKQLIVAAAITTLSITALLIIWLVLKPGPRGRTEAIANWIELAGSLATLAFVAWGTRGLWCVRSAGGRAWAPLCLTLYLGLYTLGQVLYTVYAQILHETPFPSLADAAYLADYPFFLAGVILLPARPLSRTARWRLLFDGVLVMVALTTFSWYFILGPTVLGSAGGWLASVVGTAYPLGDLVEAACLFLLAARPIVPALRPTVLLLAGGTSFSILCDSIFDVQSLKGTYVVGTPIEAGWTLAGALIGLATLAACRFPEAAGHVAEPVHSPELPALWKAFTPAAVVPAVGVLLWRVQTRGDSALRPGLYLCASTLAIVVLLRQILATRETAVQVAQTERLNRALAEANARLAARQQRLSALQTFSAALASTVTPGEMGELVMSSGALLLEAPLCRIRLLSEDGTWLDQVAAAGEGGGLFPVRRPSTEESPPAEAARTQQPVWLESAADMVARFPSFAPPLVASGYRSCAALPLLIEGRTVGTLALLFTDTRGFGLEDREFLAAVAGLIAHALDRARLYVREQARARGAEDLARMRGDFVASVSHELRTPLTAILGYGELLESRWRMLDDAARLEHVRRMVWSANRQMRLVQDLLLVGRLEQRAVSLECKPTDLATQVLQAVKEVQGSYRGQQILISGDDAVQVFADAARVTQILVNLLDNAAKYSPEGSPIDVRWDTEVTDVRICVQDRGTGISPEGQKRLFTRFGRIPGSPIRAGRMGTGLGLFLGRELARAMAGDLVLETTGPQGSTFSLRLPIPESA